MAFVIEFKVTLSDSTNKLELQGNVEWLEGGDSKVKVTAPVSLDQGELLDKWESSQSELQVDIEPIKCAKVGPAGDIVSAPCTDEIKDYASQSGKAKVTWTYNPSGDSTITLEFTEVE